MTDTQPRDPADYIMPLNMNGLEGRMLYMPAPKNRNNHILFIYGHHSSLERWWGLAQVFNDYGDVTMPDLPGFGGMQSLYTIGKKPSLDNMADYLASFVKWRYKHKKVIIIGLSYGFLVVTRMLQRYPELTKRVEFLVSAVGFSHYDDFVFTKRRMRIYRAGSKLVTVRPVATAFRILALNSWVLRKAYAKTYTARDKFKDADKETAKRLMDMELVLWHSNDVRTHMYTNHDMLTVDNCQKQVDLKVWHVAAAGDQYFDHHRVEQHLRVIFSDFEVATNDSAKHAPSVIADAKEASAFVPKKLHQALLAHAS
jgi:pimeloyl-ACP methyl ester carboxylesterase